MNKIFKLLLLSCALFSFSPLQSYAQSESGGWKLSLGAGYTNYYGDVSAYRIQGWEDAGNAFKFFNYNKYYIPEPSFGLSLEKNFTPGIGLMIQANRSVFAMADRYRRSDEGWDRNAPNWDRALNFKTTAYDAGLALTFNADNGRFLRENAFLAPYFFIGGGITQFKVEGDLYDSEGNPYDYTNPAVVPERDYETNLRDLMTETDKRYANVVPYVDFGLGLKFRLSRVVALTVQTDIKYTFTDYLDDVSGVYKTDYSSSEQAYAAKPGPNVPVDNKRGNDNGVNDFYIFNKASIQFSIGKKRRGFRAPEILDPAFAASYKMNEGLDSTPVYKKDSLLLATAQKDTTMDLKSPSDTLPSPVDSAEKIAQERSRSLLLKEATQEWYLDRIVRRNRIELEAAQTEIDFLSEKKERLLGQSERNKRDSIQLYQIEKQLDNLEFTRFKAQRQLDKLDSLRNISPSVTEYHDSTKIVFPKGDDLWFYNLLNEYYHPLGNTKEQPQWNGRQGNYMRYRNNRSSRTNAVRRRRPERSSIDSTEIRPLDSNRYSPTNQEAEARQMQQLQQKKVDSAHASYDEDTVRLNTAIKSREASFSENLNRYREDSLDRLRLEEQLNDLKFNQDYWEAYNDSLEESRRGFFKKIFKDRESQAARDSLLYYQQRVGRSQQDFDRLNNSLRALNDRNDQISRDLKTLRRQKDARRMDYQNGLERMMREFYDQNNRRSSLQPTIAPVLAPTLGGNGNNNLDQRAINDLNRRLDSLQSQTMITDTTQQSSESRDQEIRELKSQIDSLKSEREERLPPSSDQQVDDLRHQLAELSAQVNQLQEQRAAPATEDEGFSFDPKNYPTISTYFKIGATQLSSSESSKLETLASVVKNHKNLRINLTGYTDGTGSRATNERIAQKRAEYVKDLLVKDLGIDSDRVNVAPVEISNDRRGSNALDRRVDARVVKQ